MTRNIHDKITKEDDAYVKKLINKLRAANKTIKNSIDLEQVQRAIYYTKKYHGEQKQASGEPCYTHPPSSSLHDYQLLLEH